MATGQGAKIFGDRQSAGSLHARRSTTWIARLRPAIRRRGGVLAPDCITRYTGLTYSEPCWRKTLQISDGRRYHF